MPEPAKTENAVLYRTHAFTRGDADAESRTIELCFSSEYPVQRWDVMEVLDHSPESMRLDRLNQGGALLVNHDSDRQAGVIVKAWVDRDRKARAVVKFGRGAFADEIFTDVKDGIRTLVSVGYRIFKTISEKVEGRLETVRAILWEPFEVSLVAVPADPTVGIGRGTGANQEIPEMFKRNILLDTNPGGTGGGGTMVAAPAAPAPTTETRRIEVDARGVQKAEQLRISTINDIVKRCSAHNPPIAATLRELADKAIENLSPVDEFRTTAFEKVFNAKPLPASESTDPGIGMTQKEIRKYSIVRLIREIAENGGNISKLDGIEGEAHRAMEKEFQQSNRQYRGVLVPMDVLSYSRGAIAQRIANMSLQELRTLTTNVFTAGGALVGTDLQSGSFIELLRNNMVVAMLGARSLSGLRGNVAIPKQTGGATAYWLPEGGTVTASTQTMGQLSLTPHRLGADTAYDKQLLNQSSIDVEEFVRSDLAQVIALEKDRACLNGKGSAGEPLGIIQTTGLSTTVTLANVSTITYANALSAEGNIATSNALMGQLGFVTTIATRTATKAQQRFTSTDTPVWTPENTINGYKAIATNQMPAATSMVFGNWGDFIIADWNGIDIVVDPYSLKKQAQIEICVNIWTDCGARHAASFCVSNQ